MWNAWKHLWGRPEHSYKRAGNRSADSNRTQHSGMDWTVCCWENLLSGVIRDCCCYRGNWFKRNVSGRSFFLLWKKRRLRDAATRYDQCFYLYQSECYRGSHGPLNDDCFGGKSSGRFTSLTWKLLFRRNRDRFWYWRNGDCLGYGGRADTYRCLRTFQAWRADWQGSPYGSKTCPDETDSCLWSETVSGSCSYWQIWNHPGNSVGFLYRAWDSFSCIQYSF